MIRLKGLFSVGIVFSNLLKDEGYAHGRDYSWATDNKNKEVIFRFLDSQTEIFVRLKFSNFIEKNLNNIT